MKKTNSVLSQLSLIKFVALLMVFSGCTDSKSLFPVDEIDVGRKEPITQVDNSFIGCLDAWVESPTQVGLKFQFPENYSKIIIERDGERIFETTNRSITTKIDTVPLAGVTYSYKVLAVVEDSVVRAGVNICTITPTPDTLNDYNYSGVKLVTQLNTNQVEVEWHRLPTDNQVKISKFYLYAQPTKVFDKDKPETFNWDNPHQIVPFVNGITAKVLDVGKDLGDELLYRFAVRACMETEVRTTSGTVKRDVCDTNTVIFLGVKTSTAYFGEKTADIGKPGTSGIKQIAPDRDKGILLAELPWNHVNGCVSKRTLYWKHWNDNETPTAISSNPLDYDSLKAIKRTPNECMPNSSEINLELSANAMVGIDTFSNKIFHFLLVDEDISGHKIIHTPFSLQTGDTDAPRFSGLISVRWPNEGNSDEVSNCLAQGAVNGKIGETCLVFEFNPTFSEIANPDFGADHYVLYWSEDLAETYTDTTPPGAACELINDSAYHAQNSVVIDNPLNITSSEKNLFGSSTVNYALSGFDRRTKYTFCLLARDKVGNVSKLDIDGNLALINKNITSMDKTHPVFGGITGASADKNLVTVSFNKSFDFDVNAYFIEVSAPGRADNSLIKINPSEFAPGQDTYSKIIDIFNTSILEGDTATFKVYSCDDAALFTPSLNALANNNCTDGGNSRDVTITDHTAPKGFEGLTDVLVSTGPNQIRVQWGINYLAQDGSYLLTEEEKSDYAGFNIYHVPYVYAGDLDTLWDKVKKGEYSWQPIKTVNCPSQNCWTGVDGAGKLITPISEDTITDGNFKPGAVYNVLVTAFDGSGNETVVSNSVNKKLFRAPDTTKPSISGTIQFLPPLLSAEAYIVDWTQVTFGDNQNEDYVLYESYIDPTGVFTGGRPASFMYSVCRKDGSAIGALPTVDGNGNVIAPVGSLCTASDLFASESLSEDGTLLIPKSEAGHTYYYMVCATDRSNNINCSLEFSKINEDTTPPVLSNFMMNPYDANGFDDYAIDPGTILKQVDYANSWRLKFDISDSESCPDYPSNCKIEVKIETKFSQTYPLLSWASPSLLAWTGDAALDSSGWIMLKDLDGNASASTTVEVLNPSPLALRFTTNFTNGSIAANVPGFIFYKINANINGKNLNAVPKEYSVHVGKSLTLTGISRSRGKVQGGNIVVITGDGFEKQETPAPVDGDLMGVYFGSKVSPNKCDVLFSSSQKIYCQTPYFAPGPGLVDVIVTHPDGVQEGTLSQAYEFINQSSGEPNYCDKSGSYLGATPLGAGTEADPYRICTGAQLLWSIKNNGESGVPADKYYEIHDHLTYVGITNDARYQLDGCVSPACYGSSTPQANHTFYGKLNGNGYSVNGVTNTNHAFLKNSVYFYWKRNAGLFPRLSGAQISNLVIAFPALKAFAGFRPTGTNTSNNCQYWAKEEGTYVGALAGEVVGPSTITNVLVENALLYGNAYIGGLVGSITGGSIIENSSVKDTVISPFVSFGYSCGVSTADFIPDGKYVGGLVGYTIYSYIRSSFSNTKISTYYDNARKYGYQVGGLIGYIHSGWQVIENTQTEVEITGTNTIRVGGMIGESASDNLTISNSAVQGSVSGSNYVAGLYGIVNGTALSKQVFTSVRITNGSTKNNVIAYGGAGMTFNKTYFDKEINFPSVSDANVCKGADPINCAIGFETNEIQDHSTSHIFDTWNEDGGGIALDPAPWTLLDGRYPRLNGVPAQMLLPDLSVGF